jgi:hypothetical protein
MSQLPLLLIGAAVFGLVATAVSFASYLYLRSRSSAHGLQRLLEEYAVNDLPPDAQADRAFMIIIDLAPIPFGLSLKTSNQGLVFIFKGTGFNCFNLASSGTAVVPWTNITRTGKNPWIPMLRRYLIQIEDDNIVADIW